MYNIGKLKKFIKRRLLAISLICTLCFSSCGTDKVVETEAEKIVEAVTNKDMKAVETIILGTGSFVTDEKLADSLKILKMPVMALLLRLWSRILSK